MWAVKYVARRPRHPSATVQAHSLSIFLECTLPPSNKFNFILKIFHLNKIIFQKGLLPCPSVHPCIRPPTFSIRSSPFIFLWWFVISSVWGFLVCSMVMLYVGKQEITASPSTARSTALWCGCRGTLLWGDWDPRSTHPYVSIMFTLIIDVTFSYKNDGFSYSSRSYVWYYYL